MILFHDPETEWTEVSNEDAEQEWVILDSRSNVGLLPARYQADNHGSDVQGILQNCQGGTLQTNGTQSVLNFLQLQQKVKRFCYSMISLLETLHHVW